MQAPDPDPTAPSAFPAQERPTDPARPPDSPHASGSPNPLATPSAEPSTGETIGPPIAKPKPNRVMVPILIGAVIVALAGGLLTLGIVRENTPGGTRTTPETTRLQQAAEECVESTIGVTVGDAGKTMIISGAGAETGEEATIDELACILRAPDVTDAVISQIDQTRALDGRQEADWGSFHASWTYHPDDGVNMVIEER